MNATVLAALIQSVVLFIGQSDLFVHVEGCVHRWEQKQLSGLEKKQGVVAELETIGVKAAGWLIDTLIQFAVLKIKAQQS